MEQAVIFVFVLIGGILIVALLFFAIKRSVNYSYAVNRREVLNHLHANDISRVYTEPRVPEKPTRVLRRMNRYDRFETGQRPYGDD